MIELVLFQVGSEGVNQIVCRLGLLTGRFGARIENVKADVPLDYPSHKSIHSSPAGGNVVEYVRAFGVLIQGPFDGLHLPDDASNTIE